MPQTSIETFRRERPSLTPGKPHAITAPTMPPSLADGAPANVPSIQIIGVTGIPEIRQGDRLGEIISTAARTQGTPLQTGDILVVTQKVVSKAEGRTVDLTTVEPSSRAHQLASPSGRDPRVVELVLRESRSIIRADLDRGILIVETSHGFVCANAGIDASNVPGADTVALLPKDPDSSARTIAAEIAATCGATVAVIVSDTFGRAWREGHVDFAIGVAGIDPFRDYRGTPDAQGMVLKVTTIAVAGELTAAAEMVTGKVSQVPAAIVRGYPYDPGPDGVASLIRPIETDLFR